MLADFLVIFSWWGLLFLLGVFCLPFTIVLFEKFWDRGYPLAKIISLLLVSYFVWLFGSLKLLSFSQTTVWLTVLLLLIVNWLVVREKKIKWFRKNVKQTRKIWFIEELLFLLSLTFWAWIRGFQPDIHGLEKYMDYGFVNSILRSRFFPPLDMWFAGKTINYYYFGHLVSAVLTKLSGLDSAVSYNLMLATLFALSLTASFCLGANLLSKGKIRQKKFVVFAGIFSALFLNLGGNLQPWWYFFKNKTFNGYWYPDATRFIVEKFGAADNTIHEFPIYSFVVADLHGHLLDLPFVLLFLGLLLNGFQNKRLWSFGYLLILSFVLGVMSMTNFWDWPIYLLLLGMILLWLKVKKKGLTIKAVTQTTSYSFLAVFFVLWFLPFPFIFTLKVLLRELGWLIFIHPYGCFWFSGEFLY